MRRERASRAAARGRAPGQADQLQDPPSMSGTGREQLKHARVVRALLTCQRERDGVWQVDVGGRHGVCVP